MGPPHPSEERKLPAQSHRPRCLAHWPPLPGPRALCSILPTILPDARASGPMLHPPQSSRCLGLGPMLHPPHGPHAVLHSLPTSTAWPMDPPPDSTLLLPSRLLLIALGVTGSTPQGSTVTALEAWRASHAHHGRWEGITLALPVLPAPPHCLSGDRVVLVRSWLRARSPVQLTLAWPSEHRPTGLGEVLTQQPHACWPTCAHRSTHVNTP